MNAQRDTERGQRAAGHQDTLAAVGASLRIPSNTPEAADREWEEVAANGE